MTIEKFSFDQHFDDVVSNDGTPTIGVSNSAELEKAKAQGIAEGQELAKRTFDQTGQQIENRLATLLTQYFAQHAQTEEAARVGILLRAMISHLLPSLADHAGLDEIETVIVQTLNDHPREPRLTIKTAPDRADILVERIEELRAAYGFEGQIVVLADQSLGASDCRIEWNEGGAERRMDAVLERLDNIISQHFGFTHSHDTGEENG